METVMTTLIVGTMLLAAAVALVAVVLIAGGSLLGLLGGLVYLVRRLVGRIDDGGGTPVTGTGHPER